MSVAHKNQNFFCQRHTLLPPILKHDIYIQFHIQMSMIMTGVKKQQKRKIVIFLGLHGHFSKIATTISKISTLKKSLNQFADSLIPCMTQLTKINLHFLIVCKSLNKENELVTMHPYQRLSKKSKVP